MNVTLRRAGLEASTESNWRVVGTGEGEGKLRTSVVRTEVRDGRWSHNDDEIVQRKSSRCRNFGKC